MSRRPGHVMVGGRRRSKAVGGALFGVALIGVAAFFGFRLVTDGLDALDLGSEAEETEPVVTGPPDEAIAVAEAFIQAWEDEDWDQLQALTADQDLDAAAIHEDASRVLRITDATYELGEAELEDDGDVLIEFDATWELAGLGEVSFDSEVTVRAEDADTQDDDTEPAASEPDKYRVAWWYDVVHPSLTPERRFQRVRQHEERGAILAADGTPLVETVDMIELGIIPGGILDREIVSGVLADVTGEPQGEIRAIMDDEDNDADEFYPLTTLTEEEYQAAAEQLAPHAGVETRNTITRRGDVPQSMQRYIGNTGPVTAELMDELDGGYVTGDVVGVSGLERAYERRLAGDPTEEAMVVDATGLVESLVFEEGTGAEDLQTTFVPEMQLAAEEVAGGVSNPTSIVAVHPPTGEVLAAVSTPFDEFDRALAGAYAPGSSFKIVTAAGMLDDGMDVAAEVACPGSQAFGHLELTNAGGFSLGQTSFLQAFARSCNTTFGEAATEMEASGMVELTERFGFGVDYPVGVAAHGGSYPSPESVPELAMSGIGQARVTASPMHMASVAATVPGGAWRSPHVVRDISDRPDPVELEGPHEAALTEMMREVVTSGTGTALNIGGEPVYAKTGTAEFDEGDDRFSHAWIVGWREDVAFAVVVERGGSGGSVAGPVAADFLNRIQGIPVPSAEPSDDEQPEPETEADTPAQDGDITDPDTEAVPDDADQDDPGIDAPPDDSSPDGADDESGSPEDVLTRPSAP